MWRHAALVAAIAGIGISTYLLVEYLGGSGGICVSGTGCDTVRLSAFAHPLGIPMPLFGVVFYLVAAWLAWRSLNPAPLFGMPPRFLFAALGLAGIAVSAVLTGIEAFVLHAFCTWCVAQAVASVALGVAALIGLRPSSDEDPPANAPRRVQRRVARELSAERDRLRRNALLSAGAMSLLVIGLLFGGAVTAARTPSPSASTSVDLVPSTAPRTGTGSVTVVEFADFQCPSCAAAAPELQTLVDEGSITLVYRMFPLPQHQNAELAARAALAANLQGKFWPMHDQLFATQTSWQNLSDSAARAYFTQLATSVGLNVAQWTKDLDSSAVANLVASDLQAAETLNLPGTPSLFINGQPYSGGLTLDDLRSAVTAAAG
jgi:protein-disulfide isomerase